MHCAVYWRHSKIIPVLLQYSADPKMQDHKYGTKEESPFLCLRVDLIEFLFYRGATALQYAYDRGVDEVCVRLLEQVSKS